MGRPGQKVKQKGLAFIIVLVFVLILASAAATFTVVNMTEIKMVRRQNDSTRAFYFAEAGIERARARLSQNWIDRSSLIGATLPIPSRGAGTYGFVIHGTDSKGKALPSNRVRIVSTGNVGTVSRTVEVIVERKFPWNLPPAAVYANGSIKAMKFHKRDDAYIDGGDLPGIYATDDVKTKKEGEGRIMGNPPILEYQDVPEGLEYGLWEAFDLDRLRQIAKDDETYFGGDEYNKKGKYILPVEKGETKGIFFFDSKEGEALDDDVIDRKNEAKIELRGTCGQQVSGIIVVAGDLTIKDTKDCDFLFDGIIIVLDDLKMHDNRHKRRKDSNDSDIFIRGAILTDNIIEKGKGRKKKATIDIKNVTIEYDAGAIANAPPYWDIITIPGSWREI